MDMQIYLRDNVIRIVILKRYVFFGPYALLLVNYNPYKEHLSGSNQI